MGVHDGHRERLKKRFITSGLHDFEDHNILELLLFFSIPRSDTNEIAHALLNSFGSIHRVFDASVDELCKIKGVSTHTATLIKLIPELFSVYESDKANMVEVVNTTEEIGNYLLPRFYGKTVEEVYGLFLDDKNKIVSCVKLFTGTVNSSAITLKTIMAELVRTNTTSVVVAHNHPTGVALPSRSDVATTRKLFVALRAMDIRLKDHIIVADNDFISMKDSGIMAQIEVEAHNG